MTLTVPPAWADALAPALAQASTRALETFLETEETAGKTIYPARNLRMRALDFAAPEEVRAVILGQDPYHGPGQAMGLAFSVPRGVRLPPSLRNIYRELEADLGVAPPAHGDLTSWAQQGVLLLNSALSVEDGKAGSHARKGWQRVTDAVVEAVAKGPHPVAFILWGNHAQEKAARIPALTDPRHLRHESVHPSPLSARRGFFGSRPFSRVNDFLQAKGRAPVDWSLPD